MTIDALLQHISTTKPEDFAAVPATYKPGAIDREALWQLALVKTLDDANAQREPAARDKDNKIFPTKLSLDFVEQVKAAALASEGHHD